MLYTLTRSERICECGDYESQHLANTRTCVICSWANNLEERCTRFRPMKFKGTPEGINVRKQ